MFKRLRSHLSYANVTATLALFVALGGTSYAALSITGRDVQDGSLTGIDIRDGSLATADLQRGLAQQARRRGRRGRRGARGPAGSPGATNVVVRQAGLGCADCDPAQQQFSALASCEPGERATGGGFTQGAVSSTPYFSGSGGPDPVPTGWTAEFRGVAAGLVYAVCASP
jgi:hypothetical protein